MSQQKLFNKTTRFVRLAPLLIIAGFFAYGTVARASIDDLYKPSVTHIPTYSDMAYLDGGTTGAGSRTSPSGTTGQSTSRGSSSSSSSSGGSRSTGGTGSSSSSSSSSGGSRTSGGSNSGISLSGSASAGIGVSVNVHASGNVTTGEFKSSVTIGNVSGLSSSGSGSSSGGNNSSGVKSGVSGANGAQSAAGNEIIIYEGSNVKKLNDTKVNDIHQAAGGGLVGKLADGTVVMYSPTRSAEAGHPVFVGNVAPPGSGSSSSSSGGGLSSSGSSSSGGPPDPSATLAEGANPWGGYWDSRQSCTSSGKGGQSCSTTWVWVPTGVLDTSPCTGASCSSVGGPGSNNAAAGATETALSIDASPRLVKQGQSTAITWTSTNASSCAVSGPNGFSGSGTSGTKPATNIREQSAYVLTCQFASGTRHAQVTVSVIPIWREY